MTFCPRCGNELTFAEQRDQHTYCTPCEKALADYAHRRELGEQLERANQKISQAAWGSARFLPSALPATVTP